MKRLTLVIVILLFGGCAWARQASPAAGTEKAATQQPSQTPHATSAPPAVASPVNLFRPEKYAVAFIPLVPGDEDYAFLVAPNGNAVRIPMANLKQAFISGDRPFTVADWLAITNSVAEGEANLQRRYKELLDDYDALAARYNRLAEVSVAPSVQPSPSVHHNGLMRALLFQSFMQRAFPATPIRVNVRTMDCTKLPALCVGQ